MSTPSHHQHTLSHQSHQSHAGRHQQAKQEELGDDVPRQFHRNSDSNGKSGRFSWVKKLMNNRSSMSTREGQRRPRKVTVDDSEAQRSIARTKLQSSSKKSSLRSTDESTMVSEGSDGKSLGTKSLGAVSGKSVGTTATSATTIPSLLTPPASASAESDDYSVVASVKSIKSGRTPSALRSDASFFSNAEWSVMSDSVSTRPLYSVRTADMDKDDRTVATAETAETTETSRSDYDVTEDATSTALSVDSSNGVDAVEVPEAAEASLRKLASGRSVGNLSNYTTFSSGNNNNNNGNYSYGNYAGSLILPNSAGGGTTTPMSVAARSINQGMDASSVVTLASSTRNRRRRRSIDTNCSTNAIAPASILERLGTTTPASCSVKGAE